MGGRGRPGWTRRRVLQLDPQVGLQLVETLTPKGAQPYTFPAPPNRELIPNGYRVVGTAWDGERTPYYPLFPTDRAWVLVSREGESLSEHPLDASHNFGMAQPTLAWQNGTQRVELYVDGMTHTEWMRAYGVQFEVTKNGFVTSKRMSRMLRDYRVAERLPESEVRIDYLDLDAAYWDYDFFLSVMACLVLSIGANFFMVVTDCPLTSFTPFILHSHFTKKNNLLILF